MSSASSATMNTFADEAAEARGERPNRARMASFWPIYGYRAERSDLEMSAAALECTDRSG